MGFLDKLFKPKWKNENWKVRLEGVKNLDDPEILSEIAKNDSHLDVRLEAIKKINNESILTEIIKQPFVPTKIGIEAIKKINNESILIDFAKNIFNDNVRREAVKKINNESVLKDIAKSDKDLNVRKEAIKSINNEELAEKLENIQKDLEKRLEKLENEFRENKNNPYAFSYDPKDQKPYWKWKMNKALEIKHAAMVAGDLEKVDYYEGSYRACGERYRSA